MFNGFTVSSSLAPSRFRFRLVIILVLSLLTTLMHGHLLWGARIGWMLLGLCLIAEPRFAMIAVFFYGSFFVPSGFLPSFSFTLKHFHIAAALILTIEFFRANLTSDFRRIRSIALFYAPVGGILCIALLNMLRMGFDPTALRIPLNLALVLFLFILIISIGRPYLTESPSLMRWCVIAFGAGCAMQVLMAAANVAWHTSFFRLTLFHNNHVGILSVLACFPVLSLLRSEKNLPVFIFLSVIFSILIFGIAASCSRTAWLSFAASMGLLLAFRLLSKRGYFSTSMAPRYSWFRVLTVLIMGAALTAAMTQIPVLERIAAMPQLIDSEYWRYTLHDTQNFGFLGANRLRDLNLFLSTVKTDWLLGLGFYREVVDVHGFHFLLITASGVLGYSFFMLFCLNVFRKFYFHMQTDENSARAAIAAGGFLSFIAWLLVSFMESYFLQFSVWSITAMAVMLPSLQPAKTKTKKTPEEELNATFDVQRNVPRYS